MRGLLGVAVLGACGSFVDSGELPFDGTVTETLFVETPRSRVVVSPSDAIVVRHATRWRGEPPFVSGSFSPDAGAGGLASVTVGCPDWCRPDLDIDLAPDKRLVLELPELERAEILGRTGSTFVEAEGGVVEVEDCTGLVFVRQGRGGRTELHGVSGRVEVIGGSAALGEGITSSQVEIRNNPLVGLSFDAAPDELEIVQLASDGRVVLELPASVDYDLDVQGARRLTLDPALQEDPSGRLVRVSTPGRVEIRVR